MPKVMLVNVVNEEESRIAIMSDGLLEGLSVETASQEQIEGNLYKAKIVKILPGLEAVFVDYGRDKNGFLAFSDIHPKFFGEAGRGADGLRKGQELLVQVRKGELGQKGAALTTYVSIPGRYIVLMPFVNKRGVSRKIQDDAARRELRTILDDAGIPEQMGYIVRTAGETQNKSDLARDVGYLLRLWKRIQADFEASRGPTLLYQESDIVIRSLRDYFSPSIQEVWIDNEDVFKQVQSFFGIVMPRYQKRVQLYHDRIPLFSKYKIEAQIASAYEKTVPLSSGGSIVIEQTEALVSIDVNSGKTMKGKDIEETAFIANREAAEEVARQLQLRDLGGLIVIDFIDMRSSERRNEIRKVLQKALKEDKARTDVGTISKFGMLELSRQRIKPAGLRVASTCPFCNGTGKVRSAESLALSVLRLVHSELARRGKLSQVLVGLPVDAATLLLNRKKKALLELETDFGATVTICAEPAVQGNHYYIEYRENGQSRVDSNLPEDFPKALLKAPAGLPAVAGRSLRPSAYSLFGEAEEEEPGREVPEEPPDEAQPEGQAAPASGDKPGKKRKRKRRKKKSPHPEAVVPSEAEAEREGEAGEADETGGAQHEAEPPAPELVAAEEPADSEEASPAGQPSKKLSASAKRRARRRRRKSQEPAGGESAAAALEAPAEPAETVASLAPAEPPAPGAEPAVSSEAAGAPEAPASAKRRPRRRRRKSQEAPGEETAAAAPEAAEPGEDVGSPAPAEPPTPAPGPPAASETPGAPEPAAVEKPPRRKRAPARKKAQAPAEPTGAPEPASPEPEAAAEARAAADSEAAAEAAARAIEAAPARRARRPSAKKPRAPKAVEGAKGPPKWPTDDEGEA